MAGFGAKCGKIDRRRAADQGRSLNGPERRPGRQKSIHCAGPTDHNVDLLVGIEYRSKK